jgi:hypothetical protein
MSAKKIFLLLFLSLTVFAGKAQFKNTKWKATLQLQELTDAIFDFKTDTVKAILVADSSLLETMTYSVQGDALKLKRVSGQSGCDIEVVAVYHFKITNDQLVLTLADDPCNERSSALDQTRWTKMNQ